MKKLTQQEATMKAIATAKAKIIINKLTLVRVNKDLSPSDLKIHGLKQSTIYSIEDKENGSLTNIIMLAESLGCELILKRKE